MWPNLSIRTRLTPKNLLAPVEGEDELARYQRLAGASLMVAQQYADGAEQRTGEAERRLASTQRSLRLAWGGTLAAVLVAGLALGGLFFGEGPTSAGATMPSTQPPPNRVERNLAELRHAAAEQPAGLPY